MCRRRRLVGTAACLLLFAMSMAEVGAVRAQTLLEPHAKMPRFVLSNPRFEAGRQGRRVLLINFRREGDVAPKIAVDVARRVGNSHEITKVFGPQPYSRPAGTFRIAMDLEQEKRIKKEGAEIFVMHELVSMSSRARTETNRMGTINYRFKSSNSITIGPSKANVKTRPWNPEDQRRIDAWLKSTIPIPLPSAQHVVPGREQKAVPGMPALAYQREQWLPCEIIGLDSSLTLIRLDPNTDVLTRFPTERLAVLKTDVNKAKVNPNAFSPSVALVPGTMDRVPNEYELVEDVNAVAIGTRVKAVVSDELVEAEVIGIYAGRFLKVQTGSGLWAKVHTLRPKYVYVPIAGTAAAAAAEQAVKRSTSPASKRRLQRYPISIPLLADYARVTPDVPLEPGMKLACSYAKKWETVTVVKVYDDGDIRCAWDSWSNVERDMSRDDVLVAKAVLQRLMPASSSQQSGSRTWTDITGKFKVDATLVEVKDETLTLRKPDGKTLTIALDKLSKKDREFVSQRSKGK